jgi:hypothetical protein
MSILDKHKSLLPNESSEVYVIDKHTSLLHGNVRLVQKGVAVINTLAYCFLIIDT